MHENKIVGSGPNFYKRMGVYEYRAVVDTPARDPEYFKRFNQPLIERAKERFGPTITLIDIACGPADELEFIKDDPNVKIIATDIAPNILPFVKSNLGENAKVFASDANSPSSKDNIAEAGILVNALIYAPDKMLEAMYQALKPGGQCSVNFRLFGSYPEAALSSLSGQGIKILERKLKVKTKNGEKVFPVKVLDFSERIKPDGSPDVAIRPAGQQLFFQSLDDVRGLIDLIGFREIEHSLFRSVTPGNHDSQVEVFILEKPL